MITEERVGIVYDSHSLIGVDTERPCSWGNYFDISIDGKPVRVANMWYENLKHADEHFLKNSEVDIVLYERNGRFWCLIADERIPENYYHNKLNFTGRGTPGLENLRDMYARVGDPDNEFEQYENPKKYHADRGGEYDEKTGIIKYPIIAASRSLIDLYEVEAQETISHVGIDVAEELQKIWDANRSK